MGRTVSTGAGARTPAVAAVPGACDCHFHIYDARFAYEESAALRPPPGTSASYRAFRNALGLSRGVVIQPTSFGTDNRPTLLAVQELGPAQTRAIVAIGPTVTDAALLDMHARGARGFRVNALRGAAFDLNDTERLNERVKDLGWHLELHVKAADLPTLAPWLARQPVPVVLDHYARVALPAGGLSEGRETLMRLLADGPLWIKLSAPYLVDGQAGTPGAELGSFAMAVLAARPDRVLWGSDWPHPGLSARSLPMPDNAGILDSLASWCGDERTLNAVLAENPRRLYGF